MSYQIITDSCCDFTEDVYAAINVVSVPLSVVWGGEIHGHFSNKEALWEFYRQIHTGYVGPVLGAHTGPGVLGLFHMGIKR